jgi:hypothetical protein
MSIQQHIRLRHRSEGHLRFSLPAILCTPETGARLVAGLRSLEGIYRVDLYAGQGKLAIRYLDTVCDFRAVVRRFHALVEQLASAGVAEPKATTARPAQVPGVQAGGGESWLREKATEARETATAFGILAKRGFKALEKRPRWLSEFLTDLVVLYLIKIHWHAITQQWLLYPWRYRYEWAATFYLIYLQVKARTQQQA